MAKFVIECPACHRYAQARTGFFAKKRIDCTCGNVISVRMDRYSSRRCPTCGNEVVFDQHKGDKAACPVCQTPINTVELQAQNVEFTCQQCGVTLLAPKGSLAHACPVCDHVNDVTERLKLKKISEEGLASIISYEGDAETLVWKHPVTNFNYGSQLIVHESQEAVFLKDGRASDPLTAGRYAIGAERIPALQEAIEYTPNPGGHFRSEVYFINKATQMGIKWGTDSKVGLFDPQTGMHAELGASGEFNIRITDSRRFLLKVVGTTGGFRQDQLMGTNGKGYFRSMVMSRVKSFLAGAIKEQRISIFEVDERMWDLSEALRDKINVSLAEYGLAMTEFNIVRMVTPDDPNFQKAKQQFAQRYLGNQDAQIRREIATTEAQTDAQLRMIQAQTDAEIARLQGATNAENYRMMAHAKGEKMRMQGYSYQDETARMVSMAAMKNGIPTGGVSGVVGDMAGVGMSMGVMTGVMDMTRNAMNQGMNQMSGNSGWNCSCGQQNITSNFCPNCGSPKQPAGWNCSCGQQNITSNFCPNCGSPKQPAGWDCPMCGHRNITSNFCPDCGQRRS